MQHRLRTSRILLIGIGGTGGYAAHALVASGVGHLHCVDPDTVGVTPARAGRTGVGEQSPGRRCRGDRTEHPCLVPQYGQVRDG
ncbi:ThiF family adenylyltransferase, partial [Streptomyces sp. NPDC057889]|uniref:ThiF family adenylyltransferase n=1 Tax=unclassified Streptomyces TaxID=2593676 RepID=UPI0036C4B35A